MLTGRKYRLALTADQEAMCEEYGNLCRTVWNTALEQRREYRRRGAWMNLVPQCAELAEARKEFDWLRAAPSHILQQTLRDLDRACRTHGAFKVKWRSKTRWSPSFRFPEGKWIRVERLNRRWGRVKLPKLGWVKFRWSRAPGGDVRAATVSRRAGQWHVSLLVDDGETTPEGHTGGPIGVDRGVKAAVVTSAGEVYDRGFARPGEQSRYRRLQQRLNRAKKGSANRRAVVAAMNRAMNRITNRRTDFCSKTAHTLASRYSVIAMEDLRVRNMTASAKGTVDKPGRRIRQKAGLNRSILDKGWGRLETAVRNASRSTGSQVILVNPAYTSQRCYACGFVTEGNRESQATFVCKNPGCGHVDHADVNAAKNILRAAGHAVPACGDLAVRQSTKQEPATPQGVPLQLALPLPGIPGPRSREDAKSSTRVVVTREPA